MLGVAVMPTCIHCGSMQASAEMRKLPKKPSYACKDKYACKKRAKERANRNARLAAAEVGWW